jgi:hypothetical protein
MISNRTQLELVKELPQARIKMLAQMAGALETEAEELCSRAQCLEEALRVERDSLLERIETLRAEAGAIREEVSSNEDDVAIDSLKEPTVLSVVSSGSRARRVTGNRGRRWRDSM